MRYVFTAFNRRNFVLSCRPIKYMLSKNQAKIVKSLRQKKFRLEYGLFIAEGDKVVDELLTSNWPLKMLFTTRSEDALRLPMAQLISERDMEQISSMSTAPGLLAVAELPQWYIHPEKHLPTEAKWVIALDGIRDPGNLGTLLRTAAWFGVPAVVASPDTADCFNPKVIQAAMGSLFRLPVHYVELDVFARQSKLPVFGLDLAGDNLYNGSFGNGIYIVGNESHGLRQEARNLCQSYVNIPGERGAESLNAAVSASILMAELYRRQLKSPGL